MSNLQEYGRKIPVERVREAVIECLKANYARDVISVEEFESRLEEAEKAGTHETLAALVSDLPEMQEPQIRRDANLQKNVESQYSARVQINRGHVEESGTFVNIFSGTERKGPWQPPKTLHTICIFGGAELDFREAEFFPGTTQIDVFCVFGGVDITVPPGVNVVVDGIAVLGGFSNSAQGTKYPGAPVLRVTGFAVFGGVDVKVKKPK